MNRNDSKNKDQGQFDDHKLQENKSKRGGEMIKNWEESWTSASLSALQSNIPGHDFPSLIPEYVLLRNTCIGWYSMHIRLYFFKYWYYTEYSLIGKRPESMSFIRVINCQSSTMRQNK